MRSYDDIKQEIDELEELIKPAYKKYNDLVIRQRGLEKELDACIIENKLYHPLSELKDYAGKDITYIEFIALVDDNTDPEIVSFYCDEIMKIDNSGYFEYSSYAGGVFSHAHGDPDDIYYFYYHFHPTKHQLLGFKMIEVEEDDE